MPNIYRRAASSFIAITLLLALLGAFCLGWVLVFSGMTQHIYRGPFAASSVANDINARLISMHRYMKDVVLAETPMELDVAVANVAADEQQILQDFEALRLVYDGSSVEVGSLYQSFIDWRDIREEVISLARQGDRAAGAAITKGKGAQHVAMVNARAQDMIAAAAVSTENFYRMIESKRTLYITLILLATLFAVLVAVLVAMRVLQVLRAYQGEKQNYLDLIDDNILIISADDNGVITSVSSALCRMMGVDSKELVGHPCPILEAAGYAQSRVLAELRTGNCWEQEVPFLLPIGEEKWLKVCLHPLLDGTGDFAGYRNILHDISDRKVVENLSITDKLTNLFNRRHYDAVIGQEVLQARRGNTWLTFAIVDIDNFKRYNDHYGHPAGDVALARVAHQLKAGLTRPHDYVFRLGGEEFCLLFSDARMEASRELLESLRLAVENLQIPHLENGNASKSLTISIGARNAFAGEIPDEQSLYAQADANLYRAKMHKNSLVIS